MNDFDKNRMIYNRKVLEQVRLLINIYPTQRFMQIIRNYVGDGQQLFNEEPQVTHARLEKVFDELNGKD